MSGKSLHIASTEGKEWFFIPRGLRNLSSGNFYSPNLL